MSTHKHIIVGFRDGQRFYLTNTDTAPSWTEDEKKADVFCSYDMALQQWWEIDKSQFKRVFIANRQPIKI